MSRAIEPRPNTPPTEPPIIASVLFDLSFDVTGASVEVPNGAVKVEVEKDVDTRFPTVDSGRFAARFARAGSKVSAVTTSKYAQAGTAVVELI